MTFNFSRFFAPRAGAEPLSDDAIRALAPSAFAAEAHESRSARYAYIPTAAVIEGMRAEGFWTEAASGCRRRWGAGIVPAMPMSPDEIARCLDALPWSRRRPA